MSEGWIKIHRKLLDSAIFSKSEYLHVWITMLLLASHEEKEVIFNGSKILIKPGSFISSRLKISTRCKVQESKVKRIINYLKSDQQIDQVNMSTGSLFSITNWHKYQIFDQPNDHAVTSRRPADDQPVTSLKDGLGNNTRAPARDINEKNEKNVKKKTRSAHTHESSFSESPLAKWEEFRNALSSWPEEQARYYFQRFIETEQMHPGKYHYARWDLAAVTWDRRNPQEWKQNSSQPTDKPFITIDDLLKKVKEEKSEREKNERLRSK